MLTSSFFFPFLALQWNCTLAAWKKEKKTHGNQRGLHYTKVITASFYPPLYLREVRESYSPSPQGLTFEHTTLHQGQHLHSHTHTRAQTHISSSFIWPTSISSYISPSSRRGVLVVGLSECRGHLLFRVRLNDISMEAQKASQHRTSPPYNV